jgi:hypothetical protein
MFCINCLEITVSKHVWENEEFQKHHRSIYKNLLSDKDFKSINGNTSVNKRFLFNDFYKEVDGNLVVKKKRSLPDDFFGKNINIQAIVGKNGSGKSTLMDLMYMAINNFAFILEKGKKRPGADDLYYIPNLYLNLYFSKDNTSYLLSCFNESISFYNQTENKNLVKEIYNLDNLSIQSDIQDLQDEKESSVLNHFFYNIVSNYSMQSFIASNYRQLVLVHDKKNAILQRADPNTSWINSIFHKNDSYIRPIVLNPYRSNGIINLENEMELSKDRITSMLIWAEQENDGFLFYPYKFNHFEFCLKTNFVIEKYKDFIKTELSKQLFQEQYRKDEDLIPFIDKLLKDEKSFLRKALSAFFIDYTKFTDDAEGTKIGKICCAYLIIKILSITKKYPSYLHYGDYSEINLIKGFYHTDISIHCGYDIAKFFQELKIDSSHITKKVRRAIHFLRTFDKNSVSINSSKTYFEKLREYYKNEYHKLDPKDLEFAYKFDQIPFLVSDDNWPFLLPSRIDECLPPSIFLYNLYLDKHEGTESITTNISYTSLSSGEIQLLQTLSIHAYHSGNIFSLAALAQSKKNYRPQYDCINLVFDELEICFHPEYQREFIRRLIKMLATFKKLYHQVNVMLLTHSPFILSDIPRSNILYMETEEDKAKNKKLPTHTFAQNIGDMMYDSFFMEKTIGDFAEGKIRKLIKKRLEKDSTKKQLLMSDAEEQAVLKSIGDPVIRSLIDEIEANND